MTVPFVALDQDNAETGEAVRRRIEQVLASNVFVLGEQGRELEDRLCELTGANHAVVCSSGSDALCLALLGLGIGRGDAVLVPSFTFFATAGAVLRAGALPVFVDIDEATFNSGPDQFAEALERAFTATARGKLHRCTGARLKALIAVHLYGRSADMEGVQRFAATEGLPVIEDAAQAIGAKGRLAAVGSWGAAACFSFYPTKNLGGAGDGGALTTNDGRFADRLRRLRIHGAKKGSYRHEECGINARMAEIQAAVLNAKFDRLPGWTQQRGELAAVYDESLASLVDRRLLSLPAAARASEHVFHQYVVRIPSERETVRRRLADSGIETRVFYPLPLHQQPCFLGLHDRGYRLLQAERAAKEVLSLPIYPTLHVSQVRAVSQALAAVIEEIAS